MIRLRLPMECEEKMRLVEEQHIAALAYSRAAKELNNRSASCSASESEKLREAAKAARIQCLEARTAVKLHRAEHGC
jgi:hypothetical protein